MPKSASELLLFRTYKEVWQRGEDYANGGKVELVGSSRSNVRIGAIARGKDRYEVVLKFAGNGIKKQCNCAYSKDGPPSRPACKHMVATAICWDESRGIKRPKKKDVNLHTMPPAPISRLAIIKLFKNPLKADLDKIRILAEYSSSAPQPHARLPNCPKISTNQNKPLKIQEVKKALSEMEKWTRRSLYDPYFCAGEMSAAFCELLNVIKKRAKASQPKDLILTSALCVEWFYWKFNKIVDNIEGGWLFPAVRIGDFVSFLLKKYPQDPSWKNFRKKVRIIGEKVDKKGLNEKNIAQWAKEKL